MNQGRLNKYCDEVLRVLYTHSIEDPMLFGVGEFRKEQRITNDLFVKIKLSEDETKAIIHTLERVYRFVDTRAQETRSYYDLEKKSLVNSAVFTIQITDAGRYFIQTSSFTREARWRTINKWIPSMPNIVALAAVMIAIMACIICFVDHVQVEKEMEKQKAELMHEIRVKPYP